RWLATNPYGITDEFDPNRSLNIVKITPTGFPDVILPILIGDCLFNMRSALDHLAFALVTKQYGTFPPENIARGIEFPIFHDETKYSGRERDRRIGLIHPDAQAIIDRLQPCHAGNDFRSHFLWQLNELCNMDKHRWLHVALTSHVEFGIGFVA